MSYRDQTTYFSASRPGTQYYKGAAFSDTTIKVAFAMQEVVNGADDPKWRDKVMRGENATGTLVRTFYSAHYNDSTTMHRGDPNNATTKDYAGMTTNHGISVGNPSSLNNSTYWTAALAEAESAAITSIRNNVRDEQAAFGGMTFLAELASTIKGLRNPGKALVEDLGKLIENVTLHNKASHLGGYAESANSRSVNRKISRNRKIRHDEALANRSRLLTGRTFAQTWLEFTFGWAPLMNDCRDIARGLNAYFWRDTMRRAFGSSGDIQRSTSTTGTNSNAGIYCLIDTNTVTTVRVKYSVGVKRELSGPNGQIRTLAGESGSALNDLLPAIWEVIPWSFLIDYVTNIGDIINASTQSNVGVAWVSKTTVISVVQTVHSKPYQRPGYVFTTVGESTVTTKFTKITREKLDASTLGVPSLTFTFPGSKQLFNVAALLRTFLRN